MNKIINGKKYDTDTATLIAEWSNNYSGSDFHYCQEELYRKRTGEYFLYGEGGSLSKYSKQFRNGSVGDCHIEPFSEKEAKEWAEEHCDGDTYIEIFGDVEE